MNCTPRIYGELCKTPVWPNQLWGLRSRTSLLAPARDKAGGGLYSACPGSLAGGMETPVGTREPLASSPPKPFPLLASLDRTVLEGALWTLPLCPGGFCYRVAVGPGPLNTAMVLGHGLLALDSPWTGLPCLFLGSLTSPPAPPPSHPGSLPLLSHLGHPDADQPDSSVPFQPPT